MQYLRIHIHNTFALGLLQNIRTLANNDGTPTCIRVYVTCAQEFKEGVCVQPIFKNVMRVYVNLLLKHLVRVYTCLKKVMRVYVNLCSRV